MKLLGYDLVNGPPICVAEMSGNHRGDKGAAWELIVRAKEAGADAVKFQAYDPESLTINCGNPYFRLQNPLWYGKTMYELYQQACTPINWMPYLFEEAKKAGIPAFASVFCHRGLEVLEYVNCPAYKIASMEIVDHRLLKMVAATGKPMVLSTGMANLNEIDHAIDCTSGVPAALLHCVSGYPTPISEANLLRLRALAREYPLRIHGLSDHTLGIAVPIAAVALGAKIIEKHLTLDRSDGGPDAAFSLEPHEFKNMVLAVKNAWDALQPSVAKSEDSSRQLRRSLFVVEDIAAGGLLTHENVRSIRPGDGLPPSMLGKVIGKKAAQDLTRGTPLNMEMVK